MLAIRKAATPALTTRRVVPAPRVCAAKRVVCRAQLDDEPSPVQKMMLPLASMVAAALLAGAMVPEEVEAASRSGGRVGGSSGFSSRRSAPPSRGDSMRTQAAPQMRGGSTNIIVAPPVSPFGFGYSPFGFSPFGGFGIGYGVPFPFFGGILQFFFLFMVVSVAFNLIKNVANKVGGDKNNEKKDRDDWGDL